MFRLIEETVPVQRIWLDTAEQNETPRCNFETVPSAEIRETLVGLFEALVTYRNLSPEEARARLARTRPFDRHPELVKMLGAIRQEQE
jgi:hypothetical protein